MAETSQAKPPVRVVAHDASWTAICSAELEAISSVIARTRTRAFIDHVGSTAVPRLDGKPVIDLLVTLIDWNDKDAVAAGLEALGYRQEGADDALPRCFFCRQSPGGSIEAVHLHLTPRDSAYGRDMIVFRDSLIGDPEIAQRYVALKRQLAADTANDFDAYTAGKSDFVAFVLRQAAGAFGNDRLLTHQRAELDQAQRYQNFALASQIAVAVIAAIAVFVSDNGVQLILAILGFFIAFVWFALARKQRVHRSAGDQARRVVLLASGLDEKFSAEQRLRIFDKFSVPILGTSLLRDEAYFASRAAPGYRRLAELIEESAYWTRDLQQASAKILQAALAIIGSVMVLVLWLGISLLPANINISIARVGVK